MSYMVPAKGISLVQFWVQDCTVFFRSAVIEFPWLISSHSGSLVLCYHNLLGINISSLFRPIDVLSAAPNFGLVVSITMISRRFQFPRNGMIGVCYPNMMGNPVHLSTVDALSSS